MSDTKPSLPVPWELRRRYIWNLSELRLEINREMDRAQNGDILKDVEDPLRELFYEVCKSRDDIIKAQPTT